MPHGISNIDERDATHHTPKTDFIDFTKGKALFPFSFPDELFVDFETFILKPGQVEIGSES